jgi:hypothetical protein
VALLPPNPAALEEVPIKTDADGEDHDDPLRKYGVSDEACPTRHEVLDDVRGGM